MIISKPRPSIVSRLAVERPKNAEWFSVVDHEIRTLVWLAGATSGNILEIGTQSGGTTYTLAKAFPNRIVFTVDWLQSDHLNPQQRMEVFGLAEVAKHARGLPNVFISLQDSGTFDYSGKDIGFVFIDGDHSWKGVKRDTILAMSAPRPLTVAWHDFVDHEWLQVKAFVSQFDGLKKRKVFHIEGTNIAYCKLT